MDRRLVLLALGIAGLACERRDPPGRAWTVAIKSHDAAARPKVRPDAAPAKPATPAVTDPLATAGAAVWARYCALCHGPKAMGYVADHAPSLVTPTFLATATDEFLVAGIGRGRPGTAMAGYAKAVGGPLTPTEITQLIHFIRKGEPAPAPLPSNPVTGDAERGAAVFTARCQECHGTPDTRADAVDLFNPVLLETATDGFLRHAVSFGRPGTKMVAFAGVIPEPDIDAAVAYLRSKAVPAPAPTPAVADPTATPPAKVVINPKGKAPTFTVREDRFVPGAEVKAALDQKRRMVILDARPPSDWLRMHIPGAIAAPYYQLDRLDSVPNDGTWVLAYCACPHHASGIVVDELRKRGITNSAIIDEGIIAWQKAGYPVVDGDGNKVVAPPASLAKPNPKQIGPMK